MADPRMKEINPDTPPLDDAARAEIAALAARQNRAQGVLMKLIGAIGSQMENGLRVIPGPIRTRIDDIARAALLQSYHLAAQSRSQGALNRALRSDRAHQLAATMSGALGGAGGLATAAAEIPIATTMIFRAVQSVAETYGEDPNSDETRIEVLRVFGTGAPGEDDDELDTAFLGARLSLTGPAIHAMIGKIAPRFATVLSQKLATQAVPLLGAAAGAGTNYAFLRYYTEIAHVHFGLRALARTYGEDTITDAFHAAAQIGTPPPVNRAAS